MQDKEQVAPADGKLGYAITYIQDYGSGRQVQIAFGLNVGAPKEAFDIEFDKLRLVTDRQKAFMTIRDTQAKLGAERKMAAALEHMIAAYGEETEKEIRALETSPRASQSIIKNQMDTMRNSLANFKQNKTVELQQHQTNIAIGEAVIEGAEKEIGA